MKVSPVARYSEPRYPSHDVIDEQPELLSQLPERWRVNPLITSSLAGLCLIPIACHADTAKPKTRLSVAPVFHHGNGRVATGGMGSTVPVVFVSEDEATQIITEEAAKFGIRFTNGQILSNVPVPVTDPYAFLDRNEGKVPPTDKQTRKLPLELDGMDAKRQIGFEYVSSQDFSDWETKDSLRACTVSEVDTLRTAERLRKGLASTKPKGHYAVFYDPIVLGKQKTVDTTNREAWDKEWGRMEQEAAKTAREQLRLQVRDFVKWLKAEGVI